VGPAPAGTGNASGGSSRAIPIIDCHIHLFDQTRPTSKCMHAAEWHRALLHEYRMPQ